MLDDGFQTLADPLAPAGGSPRARDEVPMPLDVLHEFGDPVVAEWTTLQADLSEWTRRRNATAS